jgi:hypothetical protein
MVYIIYILSVPAGLLLTSYYLGVKKKLFFAEFFLIFTVPLISSYFLYLYEGGVVILVFLEWFLLGPFLEAIIGYTYLNITGKHLWIYERYGILNRTTSYLSAPFWAFAGLGVWSLNELIKIWAKY